MKQTVFMALAAICLLFSSCSKKSTTEEQPKTTNDVTIGGATYATAKIGTQTWTTINYNGNGGANYNGSATNNATYGKLYTLAEAKAIVVPSGWRLPTKDDVEKLLTYLGATGKSNVGVDGDATVSIKMKSKSDWKFTQGNNTSVFNAYPTGTGANSTYEGITEEAAFWTSTTDQYGEQYILNITNLQDGPNVTDDAGLDYFSPSVAGIEKVSIRFVKDN